MAAGGGCWLGVCGLVLLSGALALGRPGLVGAPVEATLDAEAQRALQFAMERYNRGSNDAFRSRVAQVVSVHKQLVAGIKYIFNVKVGRTSCRNSDVVAGDCEFLVEPGQAKTTTCTFEVVVVPWQNTIRLVKNECQ
ncbi:PREDICTED: cystatin-like [Gekko japonicus]|uniref:Cystatin-like n=1 Tax=Gekko japonicus TaxID=146911 RepID=A0ABM1JTP7_GEKJA|nr:PREDICTED: cystatin-like [Gekko japonicus]